MIYNLRLLYMSFNDLSAYFVTNQPVGNAGDQIQKIKDKLFLSRSCLGDTAQMGYNNSSRFVNRKRLYVLSCPKTETNVK